jgi:hypothetical protein
MFHDISSEEKDAASASSQKKVDAGGNGWCLYQSL